MSFAFVSGNLALDLAGTLKWRRSEPEELLARPGDLERWLAESGLLPAGAPVDQTGFDAALQLREAVYHLVVERIDGEPFDRSSLETVNRIAAGPALRLRLTDDGAVREGDAMAALSEVARSAITLLSDAGGPPVKECGRPSCTRIYLDRSRGARRTWCGMEECGNRVKAAAYRARKRQAAAQRADA